jgi:hypothetical protein
MGKGEEGVGNPAILRAYGQGIPYIIRPYRRSIIKIGYGYRMEKLEIPTKIECWRLFFCCVFCHKVGCLKNDPHQSESIKDYT